MLDWVVLSAFYSPIHLLQIFWDDVMIVLVVQAKYCEMMRSVACEVQQGQPVDSRNVLVLVAFC